MELGQVTLTPLAQVPEPVPHRLLIVTDTPARFAPLASEVDFVLTEREAICTVATKSNEYRAVVAGVAEADGRESGYRLVQLLRNELEMRCPIYLFSVAPTPSSRAYALQCGATKLLTDDQELINDLLQLVGEPNSHEGSA